MFQNMCCIVRDLFWFSVTVSYSVTSHTQKLFVSVFLATVFRSKISPSEQTKYKLCSSLGWRSPLYIKVYSVNAHKTCKICLYVKPKQNLENCINV